MSTLYTGSAAVMNDFLRNKSPLTSLVYASQLLPDKQKKAAYALLMGTLRCQLFGPRTHARRKRRRWAVLSTLDDSPHLPFARCVCVCPSAPRADKSTLEEVLESSNFMSLDRKMNRSLVLLMLYDLLLGESHAVAGGGVVKKLLMSHANHVRTAFVRLKIRKGAQADEDLLPEEIRFASRMPRYVRINTLRTTPQHVHDTLALEGYKLVQGQKFDKQTWTPSAKGSASLGDEKTYYMDSLVPNLMVFAPGTDLHAHLLLAQGLIILQDKASCMPAAALDPCGPLPLPLAQQLQQGEPWHVLDACAAPGNKTTHLLAIALEHLRANMPAAAAATAAAASSTSAAAAGAASADAAAAASSSSSSQQQQSRNAPKKPRVRRAAPTVSDFDEHDSGHRGAGGRPQATGRQVDFKLGGAGRSGVQPLFKLEAFEVDPLRFQLLHKMMARALPTPHEASAPAPSFGAGAEAVVAGAPKVVCPPCPPATVTLHNRSFLDVDPLDPRYATVTAILLDPTCSGSGMLHRIEQFYKHRVDEGEQRAGKKAAAVAAGGSNAEGGGAGGKYGSGIEKAEVVENVEALAAFQKEIVQHAMKFPNVQIVCYSTCSVHAVSRALAHTRKRATRTTTLSHARAFLMCCGFDADIVCLLFCFVSLFFLFQAEDECVVDACLSSRSGGAFGMCGALEGWFRRGVVPPQGASALMTPSEAAKCLRVAGAQDGMNGFFVAKFLRKIQTTTTTTAATATTATATAAATAPKGAQQGKSKGATVAKPAAPVASSAAAKSAASSAQTSQVGHKRGRDDEEDDEEKDAEVATTAAAAASAVGSQTNRNKKKREKLKLKKMRTEESK